MSFKAPLVHLGTWRSVLKYMLSLMYRIQFETNTLHSLNARYFSANLINSPNFMGPGG